MSGVVNYIEKGIGMWRAIVAQGHTLINKDGTFIADDPVAVQAIINTYDPLPDYKALNVTNIKTTALGKMQEIFPALEGNDTVNLVAEIYLSIAPAARQPTANMTKVSSIYTAAKNGITAVNNAANKAAVDAAVAAIVWPV